MKTISYIEEAKRRLGISTDYGIAKELGMTRGAFAHYKTGRRVIDDYTAAKLAELLKINPLEVIAAANAEREKDDRKREFWQKIASGAQAAVVGGTLVFSGLGAIEKPLDNNNMHYAQFFGVLILVAIFWRSRHGKKEAK